MALYISTRRRAYVDAWIRGTHNLNPPVVLRLWPENDVLFAVHMWGNHMTAVAKLDRSRKVCLVREPTGVDHYLVREVHRYLVDDHFVYPQRSAALLDIYDFRYVPLNDVLHSPAANLEHYQSCMRRHATAALRAQRPMRALARIEELEISARLAATYGNIPYEDPIADLRPRLTTRIVREKLQDATPT